MDVKLISITGACIVNDKNLLLRAEDLIVYCARVSNPENQLNLDTAPKLLKYLILNKHWSPFEMVDMCVEIKTSRAIAQQILRHRSFSFQEFSQRYSVATNFEQIEIRKQAVDNRQSSTDVVADNELNSRIGNHLIACEQLYHELIDSGVAKETARFVLPLTTQTTLYMKGSIRSWLTYLNLRLHKHTQKEHRIVAEMIRDIFIGVFPNISVVFDNFKTAYDEHFI